MIRPKTIAETIISFLAVCAASCVTDDENDIFQSLENGSPLPSFETVLSDGTLVTDEYLADKYSVIVFFNTSCGDCRRELPELQKAYEQTSGRAVWMAIAREEDEASVSAFWRENGLTIPFSPQTDRRIYNLFATGGIPRIYINSGLIVTAHYDDTDMPSAEDLIREINNITASE